MLPSSQVLSPQMAVGDVVDGTVAVAVSGAVDFVAGDAACELLREVARRESVSVLVLDLTSVEFCDCAGLGVLTRVRLEALRLGRRVVITAASPPVRWLLHVTGLAEAFGYPPAVSARAGDERAPSAPGGGPVEGRGSGDGRAHSTAAGGGAADSSR
jgi:anti-sigma B factor antagonist